MAEAEYGLSLALPTDFALDITDDAAQPSAHDAAVRDGGD